MFQAQDANDSAETLEEPGDLNIVGSKHFRQLLQGPKRNSKTRSQYNIHLIHTRDAWRLGHLSDAERHGLWAKHLRVYKGIADIKGEDSELSVKLDDVE